MSLPICPKCGNRMARIEGETGGFCLNPDCCRESEAPEPSRASSGVVRLCADCLADYQHLGPVEEPCLRMPDGPCYICEFTTKAHPARLADLERIMSPPNFHRRLKEAQAAAAQNPNQKADPEPDPEPLDPAPFRWFAEGLGPGGAKILLGILGKVMGVEEEADRLLNQGAYEAAQAHVKKGEPK